MDPVTHVIAGFLLGEALFGTPELVAFAAVMAFAPDLDTVTWLFPGRFGRLRHRGATHSLVVGLSVSAVGAAALAAAGVAPWHLAFAAGSVGFLSHVGLDVLNWGCGILWPFRERGVEFTVHYGLIGPLVASTLGFGVIAAGAALGARDAAMLLVGGAWLAYLVAKTLLKMRLLMRHGASASVLPSPLPWLWRVVDQRARGEEREARYIESTFLPTLRERVLFESRHRVTPPSLPLRNAEDAAAFTFLTPEVQSLAMRDLPLGVDVEPAGADSWIARWYALGWHSRGACVGAIVSVSANGAYEAKRGRIPFVPRAHPEARA